MKRSLVIIGTVLIIFSAGYAVGDVGNHSLGTSDGTQSSDTFGVMKKFFKGEQAVPVHLEGTNEKFILAYAPSEANNGNDASQSMLIRVAGLEKQVNDLRSIVIQQTKVIDQIESQLNGEKRKK